MANTKPKTPFNFHSWWDQDTLGLVDPRVRLVKTIHPQKESNPWRPPLEANAFNVYLTEYNIRPLIFSKHGWLLILASILSLILKLLFA